MYHPWAESDLRWGLGLGILPPVYSVTHPLLPGTRGGGLRPCTEALPRARATEGSGSCDDYVRQGPFIQ